MTTCTILGISGSPRKANTDFLLDVALEAAEAVPGVTVDRIYLRKEKISECIGCFRCFDESKNQYACQVHRDVMDDIYFKLRSCDGLIMATPVYFGTVSTQLKILMDRTEALMRYVKSQWRSALKDKVGGAIAVGGNRHGGLETAIQAIHHFYFVHDMIVVGTSSEDRPGCYLGAAGTTHPQRGRMIRAVREDELGIRAARSVGKRVAEVALWMKAAREVEELTGAPLPAAAAVTVGAEAAPAEGAQPPDHGNW